MSDSSTMTAETSIKPVEDVLSMDEYLQNYGKILGKKAINALTPLHIPGRHDLPDFDDLLREPFPCQKHVIAAAMKMLDNVGSGFIVGEMGTGKTLLGMTSVHKHAMRSRNQGGKGGRYRSIVLCPDHLIEKWVREIEETIPDAIVTRFGPQGGEVTTETRRTKKADKVETGSRRTLRDVVSLLDKGDGKRWEKPSGAEWYVLGRNQAKWLSDWIGLSDPKRGFNGMTGETAVSSKSIVIDRPVKQDENGRPMYDRRGMPICDNVTARVHYCPRCGTVCRDKKGVPLGPKDLSVSPKNASQKKCRGTYLEMIPNPEKPRDHGRDRICPVPSDFERHKPGTQFNNKGRRWVVKECNEPLWNYVPRPYRWSPARIIQKKMKRMFQYLIIDEVHEHKSDESGQSMACGKLIGAVDHVLALTGTIIGGYADHLYPLMMRLSPTSLREEGFEWGKDLAFSEQYGRIDKIITTKEEDSGFSVGGNVKSMRRAKSGTRSERKAVRPGVMPTMFGRHLIGSSMFITLEELADELPDLHEYIGGAVSPDAPPEILDGWYDTAVDMEPAQKAEYKRVESILEYTNRQLLTRGSMKLLGAYLWTTMDYPDRPFGWEHDPEVLKAGNSDENAAPALLGQSFLGHFDHEFNANTETLKLKKIDTGEECRVGLTKDGGIYWLDVTFNGKHTKRLAYDTGASSISLPLGMAAELGLNPMKGEDHMVQVADGRLVKAKSVVAASVKVGEFSVADVKCSVDMPSNLTHTVGYWEKPGIRTIDNFVGVVTPKSLSEDVIYPKERALIDICKKQKAAGTQTWVYVQMSGKRNVQPRLKALLEREGLKVGILRADDVEPIERERWIEAKGREFDVMISHPQLVSTGLDLFSKKEGGHNYSTIVFYETGYNLFTMRQAARRAWRIGQPRDCRIYYLYYKDTMQHKAMSLMSRKMAAAQALEGEFSEDGLAAMAGEDNLQMALAKNLSERIDDKDMQRSWGKVKSSGKKKAPTPRPMDSLPPELQLVGEALVASESKPEPEPVKLKLHTYEPEEGDDYDIDSEDDGTFEMPELTEDMLAKMFANLAANGMTLADLAG